MVKRPRAPAHLPGDEVLELLDLLLVLRVLLQVLVIEEGLEDRQTNRQSRVSWLAGRKSQTSSDTRVSRALLPAVELLGRR